MMTQTTENLHRHTTIVFTISQAARAPAHVHVCQLSDTYHSVIIVVAAKEISQFQSQSDFSHFQAH